MPRTLKIDKQRRLVITTYFGVVVYQEVLDQWSDIRAHPDFDPTFAYLIDLTGITEHRISDKQVRQLAQTADPFSPGSVRVVVAPSDYLFGIQRMYQMSGDEHPHLAVVRSMEEAQRILSKRRS